MITRDRVFAARDPRGFRPLAMGRIPGGRAQQDTIVFASETCAFDLLGANYERDVKPGELVVVGPEGVHSRFTRRARAVELHLRAGLFFAARQLVFGRVQEAAKQMGRQLAREAPVEADLVVPVPDSGVTAALGYAPESGIPLQFGLIRNHYVGRTFIEPEQRVRDFGVKLKLNPVRSLLAGKRVVLIDDSIVRGTTSRKIVRMVRDAGANEVHMRISCPPTDFAVLLRRGHALEEAADRGQQVGGGDARVYRRRFAGLSFGRGPQESLRRRRKDHLLHRLLYRRLSHSLDRCGRNPARQRQQTLTDCSGLFWRLPPRQSTMREMPAPSGQRAFGTAENWNLLTRADVRLVVLLEASQLFSDVFLGAPK